MSHYWGIDIHCNMKSVLSGQLFMSGGRGWTEFQPVRIRCAQYQYSFWQEHSSSMRTDVLRLVKG